MILIKLFQSLPLVVIFMIIFLLIILFYHFGYWIRTRSIQKNPDYVNKELGAINGTLLGLLGLMLAFTFGMASSRYDTRRQVIVQEANDIGTAILRTEIYPDSVKQVLQNYFRDYVDYRISFYEAGTDDQKAKEFYNKADSIGKKIWSVVAGYAKTDNITTRTSELIPALNDMIDITTTRRAASEATIPASIMYFLVILCCCSAFLLGYDQKGRKDWIMVLGLATMLSFTVVIIQDLDRPRSGFINVDSANEKIIELRQMFK